MFSPKEGSVYSSQKEEKRATKENALREATQGNLSRLGKECWIHASLGKGGKIVTRNITSNHGIDLKIQLYTPASFSLAEKIEPNERIEIIDPELENFLEIPMYAARRALEQSENYDIVGYMEDDLSIYDKDFFQKLKWLTKKENPVYAFLPHRCEYIQGKGDVILSGDPDGGRRDLFWDTGEEIDIEWPLGKINFYRATNPHSGCWFLSQTQALALTEYWRRRNWKSSFQLSGPLEQAGSGILLPVFKIMKPNPKDYRFLMIRHEDTLWKRHPLENGEYITAE